MADAANTKESVGKFQLLLTKFLDEHHQIIDDTCLEKLLTHLSSKENGSMLLQLQESRVFCERSLQAYEKGLVSESLLSFALRLHGHIIGTEAHYASAEIQESTRNIIFAPRFLITTNASVQCSFVQLVSALLKHKCGIEWLVKSGVLEKVQKIYEKNHSIYVARECQKFLSDFALKLDPEHAEIQQNILHSPVESLKSNSNLSFNLAIDLLSAILEAALKANNYTIPQRLDSQLKGICDELLATCQETAKMMRVAKVLALLAFAITEPSEEHLRTLEEKILSIVSRLIDAKNISGVQMILLQCQNYWCILKPRVCNVEVKYQLDHQLVYIQVMQLLQKDFAEIKKDCARNFLEKLCLHTTDATKLQGCRLRKLVLRSDDPQLYACRGIHSLIQMREFVARETSIFIFRTLMCILVQFIEASSEDITEYQNSGFLSTTLESSVILIDHFHFTWRESIETTCLLTFMQELLCEPALGQRQISQILQVMRRAIEGFMPPTLALLMNTLEDTPLQNLGPQLFRCLHSITWEVRDSAMEVVSTMALIAGDKFPAFQEHLLMHNLCSLTVKIATGDEESYVRVSALKCLLHMVAVPCFWDKCLVHEKLPELVTTVLCQESEGLVRQEAAAVASAMLYYKRFTTEQRTRMNIVMSTAAVMDLHWEVKTNALEFWKHSINQLLSEEGMLDGKFPSVTFSSRERKIVTLDTKEVQERLRRVLSVLSQTRCLAVLLSATHDPDLQVAHKAVDILTQLQTLLMEHKLIDRECQEKIISQGNMVEEVKLQPKIGNQCDSEQVIDGIIGQSDLALLASVCRTQLSLGESSREPQGVTLVSADAFLQAISLADVNEEVASRAAWLQHCSEHLNSLLTDMLEAREFQHNTNDMDCY